MSTLSGGQLHCSPIQITCSKSLDDIANALGKQLYSGKVPTTGWGSVMDDIACLRPGMVDRPDPGNPEVYPAIDSVPRRLKARYYWDAADPSATRWLGADADKRRTNHLNAIDLVLAESAEKDQFVGIITTRKDRELDYASRGLRSSFAQVDAASTVRLDSLDDAIASEFYLWLLHRYDGDQQLSDDLELELVRSLSSEDILSRPTSLKSGADIDRAELAAAVMGSPNKFGPAQFALQDNSIELSLEIELHQDGSFKILVGKSVYDGDLRRLPRDLKGQRLVDHAVFVTLPKVISAYSMDRSWPTPGLDQLKKRAKDVIVSLLGAMTNDLDGELGA